MTAGGQPINSAPCDRPQVPSDEMGPQLVRDVMIKHPKTLPGDATVGEARKFFANPKVITAVLVDATAFAGTLDRAQLPDSAPDRAPAREHAHREVATIAPDRPARDALTLLDADRSSRLVVLGNDGVTLAGLVCLNHERTGFCQG